jgi:hypothetical protein
MSFGVWTSGLIVEYKRIFTLSRILEFKIILTYLVISNFSVPWKFSKSFQKKKIIFRVKRMYAPNAGRTSLTQRFYKTAEHPQTLFIWIFSYFLST